MLSAFYANTSPPPVFTANSKKRAMATIGLYHLTSEPSPGPHRAETPAASTLGFYPASLAVRAERYLPSLFRETQLI